MSEVHVTDTDHALERANKLLGNFKNQTIRAIYNAAKRAATTAHTKASRYATMHYTLSKGTFDAKTQSTVRMDSAGGSVVRAELRYAGGVIPLMEYHTRYNGAGGVTATVKRGGGGQLEHAFIRNIGGLGVFERTGKASYPIERKYGPSGAHIMQNEQVVEQMDQTIRDTFERRLEHEITRLMNGWGG